MTPLTAGSIGHPLPDWRPPQWPGASPMQGRYCRLEVLSVSHAAALFEANQHDEDGSNWIYLPYGPFQDLESYREWLVRIRSGKDPQFYAVIRPDFGTVGVASYLRIKPESGTIEVGHIHFSPLLQRTRAATESMYLMMRRVFDELGYRRYEWKCDSLNQPSRNAAQRFGFTYEGTFRQATVYKGRNRDTSWYSVIDGDWPRIRDGFEAWLDPANFDDDGRQRTSLDVGVSAGNAPKS